MDVNTRKEPPMDPNVHEGTTTRTIENQTVKVPSVGYLGLAVGSMILSATFSLLLRKRDIGNFIGLWVPSLLVIGLYNKIVKIEADLQRQALH